MFLGKFTQHGYPSPNHQLQRTIAVELVVRIIRKQNETIHNDFGKHATAVSAMFRSNERRH